MRTVTTRTIAGRVNSDGTAGNPGSGYTSRRTAAGTYGVVFPGSRLVGFTSVSTGGGIFGAAPSSLDGTGATVLTFNSAGATTDGAFQFTATLAA